jgi:hypothetical protein
MPTAVENAVPGTYGARAQDSASGVVALVSLGMVSRL